MDHCTIFVVLSLSSLSSFQMDKCCRIVNRTSILVDYLSASSNSAVRASSFTYLTSPTHLHFISQSFWTHSAKQEGELRLRDGSAEPARRSEPALQSCVFPAWTNPIVSQFGHMTELDQPSLGPLSNWQVAPKASLWSYLECLFLVLDACKEPSVIVILVL